MQSFRPRLVFFCKTYERISDLIRKDVVIAHGKVILQLFLAESLSHPLLVAILQVIEANILSWRDVEVTREMKGVNALLSAFVQLIDARIKRGKLKLKLNMMRTGFFGRRCKPDVFTGLTLHIQLEGITILSRTKVLSFGLTMGIVFPAENLSVDFEYLRPTHRARILGPHPRPNARCAENVSAGELYRVFGVGVHSSEAVFMVAYGAGVS
jgi:hypothetical protein